MPFGLLTTLPEPLVVTVSAYCSVDGTNVALTPVSAFIVTRKCRCLRTRRPSR